MIETRPPVVEGDEPEGNLRFPDDIAAPVGIACGSCIEPILPGDWGQMVPFVSADGYEVRPHHGECLVRDIFGGIEHLTAPAGHAPGTCYEGTTFTRRESAIAAFGWLRANRQ